MSMFLATIGLVLVAAQANTCHERCDRLKDRSLERVGFDEERLELLFERQRPLGTMKDVCWRLYDHLDCMKRCPTEKEHVSFAKKVKNKCKFVLRDMEQDLQCISRHHSFLNIRCSSFIKEAEQLRSNSDLQLTPPREACRFLHLNTICLENSVTNYCKTARKFFRRLHFRDYFLSFVLPKDDSLFDDDDLDSCQLFNFVKESRQEEDEKEEQIKAEEKRRKILGDYDDDYEEELTTLANGMDDEYEETMTTFTTINLTTTEELGTILDKLEETTPAPINNTEPIYEDYGEYEASDLPVNVVPIEGRNFSSAEDSLMIVLGSSNSQENESVIITTTPKKVFSDDSMESDPPDFLYSSLRGISTSTIKYVADRTQENLEEPLDIDTTTLFGIEETTQLVEKVSEEPINLLPPSGTTQRPLLSGDIIVKPILSFGEMDTEQEEDPEVIRQDQLHPTVELDPEVLTGSEKPPQEHLEKLKIWEYAKEAPLLTLAAVFLVSSILMMLACSALCCACRRSNSYHVQKCEA